MLLRHRTTDALTLHASGGLAYQPAAFPIALPGIADAVLQRGLQRAIQTELGAGLELPASLTAELSLRSGFVGTAIAVLEAIPVLRLQRTMIERVIETVVVVV